MPISQARVPTAEASRAAAVDALRERFGEAAVQRGLSFAPGTKRD